MSASDFLTALGTGSGLPRAVCAPAMTLRFTEVRCAAAHMGAALQGIFVGQGPCALPGSAGKLGSGRCRHRPLRSVTRGTAKRAVGEIGEALPVAEEASRFRGSAPIGGHDSDRESVGTTVGNRLPLRTFYCGCGGAGDREGWTCRLRKISGDKYGDGLRSQCAHWLRNDIAQGSRRLAAKNRTGGALPRLCA